MSELNSKSFSGDLDSQGVRVKIIGVGGAGVNAVDRVQMTPHEQVHLAGVNTDAQALDSSPIGEKILIGKSVTRGLSTGGDVEIGQNAAEKDEAKLRQVVDGQDLVFLVAGLGGGTGSGAGPVIARLASEQGALVIAFVTLPFTFEGARHHEVAETALAAMRTHCDAVIPLPNDLLLQQMDESATVLDAFAQADAWIGRGVQSICAMLTQTGLINLDFAMLRKVFQGRGGKTLFGLGRGEGDDFMQEALNDLALCPLLHTPGFAKRADSLLVNIIGGTDLSISHVNQIMTAIAEKFGSKEQIVLGAVVDESFQQSVEICVIGATHLAGYRPERKSRPVMPRVEATPSPEPRQTRRATTDDELFDTSAAGSNRPVHESKLGKRQQTQFEIDQEEFLFVAEDEQRGFFDNTERNIFDGEDLDVPTYLRRGVRITL
ncbi:cell division protein FtsZ [Cerasicoccus arenae]|uniref:Cell division protein FtsZ n=1 Tax=Cerasicoccus arenae TaxID=424488 RepID=A0A8J3GFG2_9BACT|nr:cell division protein FtsZ [Cerasicoccus arenae]MBK1856848.1 cell division protein FtsZ [Cerasicoccus arenae]GHC11254.1 cell division protein FtsZ [Cerasicoccus arenae]